MRKGILFIVAVNIIALVFVLSFTWRFILSVPIPMLFLILIISAVLGTSLESFLRRKDKCQS